ncbi:MAG TPA: imidazole glycerol phosphate synthase subunit HisH [Acidimicrobiales bacterium]|nr:imidazole glycerol phosphate synthase subunit HisH [Acidimicrobiales bacterium]
MIAVLDYGIGNLRSAEKALQHVGADARLVADPDEAAAADGLVLPGVGGFGPCMDALVASGLAEVARQGIASGRPFLGICVGLQMLFDGSEEDPGVAGLGVLPGINGRLSDSVKRPQMQWNVLHPTSVGAELMAGLPDPAWVYFVHSYAPPPGGHVAATCEYGGEVVAAIARDNVWGTQFHPEKSGVAGLALLDNFVRRCKAS